VKVHLLHPDRDLDLGAAMPPEGEALVQDLSLEPILAAMAGGDALFLQVARQVLLADTSADPAVVAYRQDALADCLAHRDAVRTLYACALGGLQAVRDLGFLGLYAHSPGSTLYSALRVIEVIAQSLRRLRSLAETMRTQFRSDAFGRLAATVLAELTDEFFAAVERHRAELSIDGGLLLSARLGPGNRGVDLTLRRPKARRQRWLDRIMGERDHGLSFTIAPRDESGHRALREIRDSAVNEAANALAQANDHMLAFFAQLRAELAFYLGCLRLEEALRTLGVEVCRPVARPAASRELRARALVEVSLALREGSGVVANDLDADGRSPIIITGANRGGKTTFLRALGQAHCMMAAGMFVAARQFQAGLSGRRFSHFPREEDPSMRGGRLDEELTRLRAIVERLHVDDVLLLNEPFASTNEVEGSELARQVIGALSDRGVRVVGVTHLYAFARTWAAEGRGGSLFLRAERLADGGRTFRILPGPPLETSYADDVYRRVFGGQEADPGGGDRRSDPLRPHDAAR
jgi:hypothetical protein